MNEEWILEYEEGEPIRRKLNDELHMTISYTED